ncbi:uncharacterized protein [Manis javanica]|uniref:uncharacterized protein n=1 Tax=Manis javanica TaxID=9974 RepID=UPI003C6D1F7C
MSERCMVPGVFSTTDVLYFSRPTWITVYASLVLPAPELLPRSPRARSTVTWTCGHGGESGGRGRLAERAADTGPSEKLSSGGGRSGANSERRRRRRLPYRPAQLRAGLGWAEPAAASPPPRLPGRRPPAATSAPRPSLRPAAGDPRPDPRGRAAMLRPRTAVLLSRGRRPAWSWRRGGGGRAASAAGWAGLPPWPRPGLRAFQTPPCRRLRYILRPGRSLPGKVPAGTRSDSPASATGKRILDFDQCCSMCLICITSFHPQSKAVGLLVI